MFKWCNDNHYYRHYSLSAPPTSSLHEFLSHQFYSSPVVDPQSENGITFRFKAMLQHYYCIVGSDSNGQFSLSAPPTSSLHELLSHQFYSSPVVDPQSENGITFRLKAMLQHSFCIAGSDSIWQLTLSAPPTSSLHELLSHQFYSSPVVDPQSENGITFRFKAMLQHSFCVLMIFASFSFVNLVYWLTTGVKCRYKAPVNRSSDNIVIVIFIFLLNIK